MTNNVTAATCPGHGRTGLQPEAKVEKEEMSAKQWRDRQNPGESLKPLNRNVPGPL